jgi:uracil-DNA glycosylase family 4
VFSDDIRSAKIVDMKHELDLPRAARQVLRDLALAGLSEIAVTIPSQESIAALTIELSSLPVPQPTAIAPLPVTSTAEASQQPVAQAPLMRPAPPVPTVASTPPVSTPPTPSLTSALPAQARTPMPKVKRDPKTISLELAKWAKTVSTCQRCQELAATRTQTVFGVGNPTARVMFIGEAPGADEDEKGEPFVGRAGQLLNKIIAACGWERSDLYICNILRCRPPGNRNPLPSEAANCREYLDAQIALVQPEYIVCWGTIAAQNLLGLTDPISRMRKKFFEYKNSRVLCTYHPSYLLRNPSAKKDVWEDLQILLVEMGVDLNTLPKPAK